MEKIKIAIVGVGNCASSLVQGIEQSKLEAVPGSNHVVGGYKISDIEIVAAFDIDSRKVGKNLHEAILKKPNCTNIFFKPKNSSTIIVERVPTFDGISPHTQEFDEDYRICESSTPAIDLKDRLLEVKADFVINYLPVGSQKATEYVANSCIASGTNFINAIPVFISSSKIWIEKFKSAGLFCIGDDIKSQLGATIVHRNLCRLFNSRGVTISNSYQLNVGGNTDFLNMLNQDRLESKKKSKTQSVTSQMKQKIDKENIHVGPSDYVPFLKDNKLAFINVSGQLFGGNNVSLEIKLSVEDSPNSAGSMIDAIRLSKRAVLEADWVLANKVSSLFFKSPLKQESDEKLSDSLGIYYD